MSLLTSCTCSVRLDRRLIVAVWSQALFLIPAIALAGPPGADGDLYVASLGSGRVVQFDGSTGAFSNTFVPNGGQLASPFELAFGPDGNLYVSDAGPADAVQKYHVNTAAFISTFASGNGLSVPTGLTFGPNGNLYVTGANSANVIEFDGTTGAFVRTFVPAGSGGLSAPRGLMFGPNGNFFAARQSAPAEILQYDGLSGAFINVFTSGTSLTNTEGMTFGGANNNLFVSSVSPNRISEHDGLTGVFIRSFTEASLSNPTGMRFGANGNLFVSSGSSDNILEFDAVAGSFVQTFASGGGMSFPYGLAFKPSVLVDCNGNTVDDATDIAQGTSGDCNVNDVPDECDIAGPTSDDCNSNGAPDECENDCNTNDITDACDIAGGTSDDCDSDGGPDECQGDGGVYLWIGPDGGLFHQSENWDRNSRPQAVGQAMLAHTGAEPNRCRVVDLIDATIVCSVEITSTGGLQSLEIASGRQMAAKSSASIGNNGALVAQSGSAFIVDDGGIDLSGLLEIHTLALCSATGPLTSAGGTIALTGGSLSVASLDNQASSTLSGFGTIEGSVTNDGEMTLIADTVVVGDLNNEGTITVQSGLFTVTGNVSGSGTIIGGFGGRSGSAGLMVQGDLDLSVTDPSRIELGSCLVQFNGDPLRGVQRLEAMAPDVGRNAVQLPDAALFSVGTLRIGPSATTVRLVNRHDNSPGAIREAVYVRRLILEPGTTLDLAGQRLYYSEMTGVSANAKKAGGRIIDTIGGGGVFRRGG